MSLILCSKSECFDKIMDDYNENVASYKGYNLWASKKYQSLVKFLDNRDNAEIVTSAMNFVTRLSLVSIADRKLKREEDRAGVSKGNQFYLKKSLLGVFDPLGKEQMSINHQILEIQRTKREEIEKNAL